MLRPERVPAGESLNFSYFFLPEIRIKAQGESGAGDELLGNEG